MPYLRLSDFVDTADMVRIVPVEAPKNFTADITLRKGSAADSSLPVVVKKTELETDYPYLTGELAALIGRNQSWTAKAATVLQLKADPKYHQRIRASSSSYVQRYSDAAVQKLKSRLAQHPNFDPYVLSNVAVSQAHHVWKPPSRKKAENPGGNAPRPASLE